MSEQLVQWLEDNKITEVECLISDMAGIPRVKFCLLQNILLA